MTAIKTKNALPASPEMERALLSAILYNPEAIYRITNKIQPRHFYRNDYRAIYEAMVDLAETQKAIDLLTVSATMEAQDSGIDNAAILLAEMTTHYYPGEGIDTHCAVIVENWQRRELMTRTFQVAQAASNPAIPVADTLSDLTNAMDQVCNLEDADVTLSDQLDRLMANSRAIFENPNDLLGPAIFDVPTIDKAMDGAHGGELCIVSGGTGEGKSSLFNTAQSVCIDLGVPCYDWSGELDVNRRLSRLIAARTGLNSRAIYKGMYYDAIRFPGEFERVVTAKDEIEETGHVYEGGAMTLSRAVTRVTHLHRTKGIKIFFFDRKELFDLSGIDEKGDAATAIFMNRLRTLAVDLDVQIFVGAQLRKSYEDKPGGRPTKADIMGTAATMQAATEILICYRPEKYGVFEDYLGNDLRGKSQLLLVKNTNGEEAEATTYFTPELALFSTDKPNVKNGQQETNASNYGTASQMVAASTTADVPF